MDWVKLRTLYYRDPKIAGLPDADTEMMFIRSLAYCGEQETSGFVPKDVVPMLARRRAYAASAKALCQCGLWVATTDGEYGSGYLVARWDDHQHELELLADRRAADRERKRKQRAKEKHQVNSMSRDMSADSHVTVTPQRVRDKPPYPPPSGGTCSRHKRPRRGCAACVPTPQPPPVDALCGHGRDGATCPFCRQQATLRLVEGG